MSASSREWDDWLWVPDMTAAEDKADVFEIVQADYDEDTVLRLFSTVERRLSQCVLHFDDFASDDRVVYAITSELNFLRSILGEARLTKLVLPQPSSFMRTLQNTLDRKDWSQTGQLRRLASALPDVAGTPMLDEHDFAFATWWTALPRLAKDIPVSWIPFDLAGEVIRSGLDKFETLDGVQELTENLSRLANEMQGLQTQCEASGRRLNDVEEELGKRLAEVLGELR